MSALRKFLMPLLIAVAVAACANSDSDTHASDIPFSVIAKGQYSGIGERRTLVVEDNAQWHALWREHRGGRGDRPPLVNFDQSMVIAVFMGEQRSGGYSIDIRRIQSGGDTARVELSEQGPAPGHIVTMALTQPFVMAQIPRIDAPIRFDSETEPQAQ